MGVEIERKFLLDENWKMHIHTRQLDVLSVMNIEQTYLALVLDEEIRVRKIELLSTGEHSFYHTYKKGSGLERQEIEFPISQTLYEQLLRSNGNPRPLMKVRTTLSWDDYRLEIDEYEQFQLVVVEVEFASLQAANDFQAPSWFGEELSESKVYSNKQLWKEIQQS